MTIDFPSALDTEAFGINNLGQNVGDYQDESHITHGFLYKDGRFTTIELALD
jgi:probable HAF family extracellular repeat protein